MKRYIVMCSVGLIAMTFQLIIFNCLRLNINPEYANLIAVECAIILNFFLNNHLTFKSHKLSRDHNFLVWIKKLGFFNFACLGAIIIQFLVMRVGVNFTGHGFFEENGLVIFGIFLGSIYSYFAYSRLVWKTQKG